MWYGGKSKSLQRRLFVLPISCLCCLHSSARFLIRRGRGHLKYDGTRAETRFRLPAKQTSPFKSAGVSVLSTTGSRGVGIGGSNAGYTMFRGSVKGTGYTLHSPVSPSLTLPCVTVCQYISTGVYKLNVIICIAVELKMWLKKICLPY